MSDDQCSNRDCTIPVRIPLEELPKYSLQVRQFEAKDVESYINGQAPDETIQHIEHIKEEVALGSIYSIWDVATDKTRWWVISNPMNLYSQDLFQSLDYTISFHIGLMARVLEQQRAEPDQKQIQFGELERRQEEIHSALDVAVEAIDFQKIGLQLRELLVRLGTTMLEFVVLHEGTDAPKRGDFKAISSVVSDSLFPGKKNQALRKFLKGSAADSWELVSWLTYAQNADKYQTLIAMQSVDALLGHFLFGLVRSEHTEILRCPMCNSRKVLVHFDVNLGDDGANFHSCRSCGWTDNPDY